MCFRLYVVRGTQILGNLRCDLADCAPLIVVDCGIVHTVACLVSITVSKRNLFRERGSTHTEIVAVVPTQISHPDCLRQPFCHLGTPKIIFIFRGTSACENVTQARKRRGIWWPKDIAPLLPISGHFLQYFERDFELRLKFLCMYSTISVGTLNDVLRNPWLSS